MRNKSILWTEDLAAKAKELYLQGVMLKDIAKEIGVYPVYFWWTGRKHLNEITASVNIKDYEMMCKCKLTNSKKYDRLKSFNSSEERRLQEKSKCFCRRMRLYEKRGC